MAEENSVQYEVRAVGGITFSSGGDHVGYREKLSLDPEDETVKLLEKKGKIKKIESTTESGTSEAQKSSASTQKSSTKKSSE